MADFICTKCGNKGRPRRIMPGSVAVEAGLWLLAPLVWFLGSLTGAAGIALVPAWPFLLVAVIYSLWRIFSAHRGCPACGAPDMVPIDSPRGKTLLEEMRK